MDPAAAAAIFARTPVNRFLGIALLQRDATAAVLELPLRPEFLQEEGVVQGGILTALADMAAVYVLWPDVAPDSGMAGVALQMQFLASARLEGGPLRARGTLLRRGTSIAVCEAEVHQGERFVCKGTFTFQLRSRGRQ